ncbi:MULTISPECIES: polysaccharide pyruvyl transferase family protein [Vibrio harveyi group]|uniref:polysaccharide pyruvyl transferase family protein n=1 Tax=Vibrio harveyi group TaxID=717610 RepID=UPI0010BE08F3|nr:MULTISPECIES: polysaccharide pyruvyl transferase family protein [Vibrio harveyi group]MCE9843353.1 polysaccharide pyruvyl transferase family protein [Vibrio antiquarius]TKF09139.1 polysaccharide pyruvyl transferase family protein [Vibrio alginolyticus]
MKVMIVGWYGTETIGDRAILGGIIKSISECIPKFDLLLGALYPFYSERMLSEDSAFFKEITNGAISSFELFDSTSHKDIVENIKRADVVIMGGGPLMDLPELNMVHYTFAKAKKLNVKTLIWGCGVGPLYKKSNRKTVSKIFELSDSAILRDSASLDFLRTISKEFSTKIDFNKISVNYDPAVNCVLGYNDCIIKNSPVVFEQPYIAVNLRSFPKEYSNGNMIRDINEELKLFVSQLADKFPSHKILLVPMHYFHVGGDDRIFLNDLSQSIAKDNVSVQNRPLTLKETISIFENAYFNIGMRFHSVVIQTICSGRNYILDYTEPKKGKIFGFVSDIDLNNFYDDRYICLQNEVVDINKLNLLSCEEGAGINLEVVSNTLGLYSSLLKEMRSQ